MVRQSQARQIYLPAGNSFFGTKSITGRKCRENGRRSPWEETYSQRGNKLLRNINHKHSYCRSHFTIEKKMESNPRLKNVCPAEGITSWGRTIMHVAEKIVAWVKIYRVNLQEMLNGTVGWTKILLSIKLPDYGRRQQWTTSGRWL